MIGPAITEARLAQILNDSSADPTNSVFLCPPAPLMMELGLNEQPVMTTFYHLQNITNPKDVQHPHWHGLPLETVAGLSDVLSDPAIVFRGKRGALVFVSDKEVSASGAPLAAIIKPNGLGWQESYPVRCSFLLSAYYWENLKVVMEKTPASEFHYIEKTRARLLLSSKAVNTALIDGILSGPGVFLEQIQAPADPKGEKDYRMNATKQLAPGDLIYSGAAIELPAPGAGRLFVVTKVDANNNIQAAPTVSTSALKTTANEYFKIKGSDIEGRMMRPFFVALHIEVDMSAKWPILKQPVQLSAAAAQALQEAKTVYADKNQMQQIQADQPVEPVREDIWEKIEQFYHCFKKDPKLIIDYLVFSSRFYMYSARNQAMIYHQNPYATFAVSKMRWAEMKYRILPQHEHKGIEIRRPQNRSYIERKSVLVPIAQVTDGERRQISAGSLEVIKKTYFVPMLVYDISQTNCPASKYPKIYDKGYSDLKHATLFAAVKQVAELEGIKVTVEDITSISLGGFYQPGNNTIHISDKEQDTRAAVVILHEYAHALLHNTSSPHTTHPVREFEAQGLALCLMQRYDLPITQNEQAYIVSYLNTSMEQPGFEIEKSLSRLHKQFCHCTERIDQQLALARTHEKQPAPVQSPQQTQEIEANFLQNL